MKNYQLLIVPLLLTAISPAFGGEADVLEVKVNKSGETSFRFDVTVAHNDSGWQHYADKWEIIDQTGKIIGTRVLYHPHVDEQPFTRSLSGVEIPQGTKTVRIRAHDSVHEYGGEVVTVELP